MNNRLLAKLPPEELELLRPHFDHVSLKHGHPIIVPDEPIKDIYFPLNSLLSLVTRMENGATVESGTIGREGMSGLPVLLDAWQTTMETVCQVPGEALKVKATTVKEVYDRRGALHKLLNRYSHTVIIVGSQCAACNALHKVEQRFCKWVLMSSDGIGSDEVHITHEYLANMLGIRRASVSEVAHKFQLAEVIAYSRGHVRILDRERMQAAACECYARTKSEYERLFGED